MHEPLSPQDPGVVGDLQKGPQDPGVEGDPQDNPQKPRTRTHHSTRQ